MKGFFFPPNLNLINNLYLFFRKTDCVHHPNWAQPALPLLLRREDPLTDSVPPLRQLSDGEIGDDIQRKWLCCSLICTCSTHTYTHTHRDKPTDEFVSL